MIVKCECDCKYCEESICSKEEIEISDTGEGMSCDGYHFRYATEDEIKEYKNNLK